jgi:hypothetical protein
LIILDLDKLLLFTFDFDVMLLLEYADCPLYMKTFLDASGVFAIIYLL